MKNLLSVFFPSFCINCESRLIMNEQFLCTLCLNDLPIIAYNDVTEKILRNNFYGRVPIEEIYSFLYFNKSGITQNLIHELKYKKEQGIGIFLGKRMCYEIERLKLFKEIDYIVPVPLHEKRQKERGFNQVHPLGKALSKQLNKVFEDGILKRVSKSETQTLKQRFERFSNADSKFQILDHSLFENKHVLLIDDVITTGATLISCCKTLLKVKNIKISICTIAYTEIV